MIYVTVSEGIRNELKWMFLTVLLLMWTNTQLRATVKSQMYYIMCYYKN